MMEGVSTVKRGTKLFASLLLTASLGLTACSGGGSSSPTQPGTGGGQSTGAAKVKIRLASWVGADEAKELQGVIDKVNAKATTYEIVSEPIPADYYTKIQTMIAGNTAPDLMWLGAEYMAPYASKGALLDLSDRLPKDSRAAAKVADYFQPVMEAAQWNGKTYGLPWIAQPVVLYYNKALFKVAGVPEPTDDWTWQTFQDAAKKLTDKSKGQYGTTFNGWPPVQMFIWQAGGEVISPDLKSSPVDSPEAIKGLEFYSSIIYNEAVSPARNVISEQGTGDMFKKGKVAMIFGGAADDLDRAPGLDVGVARVPKGPKDRTTFAWTASTAISAQTKNPQQAYDALVDLTEGVQNWKVLAPRKSLATKEQIVKSDPRKEKAADVIIKAAADMRAFRIVPRHPEWDTTFFEQLQDPLYSKKGSAADLAKAVRPKLEALLK
jgi:multiple sugar transport system substrate-binding protein